MTITEFKESLSNPTSPKVVDPNLHALWLDAKGRWNEAHNIVQETGGPIGDWIHAYLHRKEGDLSNASYWYAKVGKKRPDTSLNDEWEILVNYILIH